MDCSDICIRNWYIDAVMAYCIPMWIYWINVFESESETMFTDGIYIMYTNAAFYTLVEHKS